MLILMAYEDTVGSEYMTWPALAGRWHSVVEGEVVYRGRSPHFGAARALIKAGHDPDEDITTLTRAGTVVFKATLAALSGWSVEDRDHGRSAPSLRRYREMPNFSDPPIILTAS
jgi:hypothetical protein